MRFSVILLFWLSLSTINHAAELVPFTLPWDDVTAGPTDLSDTLEKPAGKSGFVQVRDGHLFAGKKRLRLFGANVTAGADFPDHETADKVAGRMAKFGLNGVRFHFLDATWGSPRLINYESGNWQDWNADSLDRFDYFIARLKEHGIYIDLNLLVGRRFGVGDGVDPKINQLDWKVAHAVGFFHAPHFEAQKQYARRLLTHVNPYTKIAYADEPAVAIVEINNENGLIHTWLGGGFDKLPDVFAADLQRQWNHWLKKKYPDTAALSKAWGGRNEPLGEEMLANAKFEQKLESWNIEQHQGAVVDARAEGGTAILRVRKTGTADWHIQFNQGKLAVKRNQVYTVSFRAAANRDCQTDVSLMQAHDPWGSLGFRAGLSLTNQPRQFTFTFIASEDDANARLNFGSLNQADADFRLSDISFKPGGRVGLGEGESLEKSNIAVPKAADEKSLPAGGRQDWIRFLWETERKHWTEMRRFLKDDLGVKAPVVGTIVGTSTPNLMADMDAVDTHAYWQHPQFPGKEWDAKNWFVKNLSMVDYPEEATVFGLAFQRVAGKPLIVSEYNHPAPNDHASEGPLFIAAFGAFQDWDAIFLYTYSHEDKNTKAGRIPGFFDVGQHPTIMANVPIASLIFRRGDLQPAKELIQMSLPPGKEIELIAQKGHAWGVLPIQQLGVDLENAVRHRVALDVSGKSPLSQVRTSHTDAKISDTGELIWRMPAKNQGVLELRSPRTKAVIGHIDNQHLDMGQGIEFTFGTTRAHWCTLSLTLLEGESFDRNPRRALLAATGVAENTAMGWKDKSRTTVGADWGTPPSLVETISATIQIPHNGKAPVLYPLNDHGQRGPAISPSATNEKSAKFTIGPPQGTVWYEIVYINY